tara:strand:- start:8259 stop:8726 length:468 start_codon:yes stop_codon:yes gene_type:complete
MDPFTMFLMAAGTGVQAFGQMQAGRIKAGDRLIDAQLSANNEELIKVQAMEESLLRDNQFKIEMGKNLNMLTAQSGRAYDASIDAFFKGEKKAFAENKKSLLDQSYMERLGQRLQTAQYKSQSKNAIKSATVNAFSTLIKGGSNMYDTRGGKKNP